MRSADTDFFFRVKNKSNKIGTLERVRMSAAVNQKVVFVGEASVGKTALVARFVTDAFQPQTTSTVSAAFFSRMIVADVDSKHVEINLGIWDTAGQERFQSLAPIYFRGSNAAVLVFDVTDASSFEKAKKWLFCVRRDADPGCHIVVAGNKVDLGNARTVTTQAAANWAKDEGVVYFETSAKENIGVEEMFSSIAKQLAKNVAAMDKVPKGHSHSTLTLEPTEPPQRTGGGGLCGGNSC